MNSQTSTAAPIGKVAYPAAFSADVAIAITTLGTFLIGYFVPLQSKEVS